MDNKYTAKVLERGIADRDVERVLKSGSSAVCQYVHEGQPRYGFWHPENNVFVAWQPAEAGYISEVKTALKPTKRLRYVMDIAGVVLLRHPRGR